MVATCGGSARDASWYHARSVRAAFGQIRAVIVGATALGTAACAAAQQGTPIGMSDAVPEPASAPVVEAPRGPWADFAAARAWPEAAPASVALSHFRDGTLVHVRVEPAGLQAYRQLSAETGMPDGARVVAWHESPSGALLGGYVLEKRSEVWTALQLDAGGALVAGDHARCLRCHDMAPHDHLFGVPAATPPRESIALPPR